VPRPPVHAEPLSRDEIMTSMLTRLPTVPGDLSSVDDIMQRLPACVDDRNIYTNTSEQWLPYLPLPPPPHTLPLLSESTQTTASGYINTHSVPLLTVHDCADTPFDNYQYSPDNLPLPSLSTHATVSTLANVPTHVGASPSYTVNSQRVPIAVEQADLSAFSRVDQPTGCGRFYSTLC